MQGYAQFVSSIADEDVPLLRELLSYDVQCEISCPFVRHEKLNHLIFQYMPLSPMHWSRQVEWPFAIREGDIQPHHTVLSIGDGWSVLKFPVAKRCHKLVSLDNDQSSLDKAAITIKKLGFTNIDQVWGDAVNLPFLDNTFDRVLCISVLEHIKDKHLIALDEIKRVLKPNGIAIVTVDLSITDGLTTTKDFHLKLADGNDLLARLDIPGIVKTQVQGAYTFDGEGGQKLEIVVLMMKYVKE